MDLSIRGIVSDFPVLYKYIIYIHIVQSIMYAHLVTVVVTDKERIEYGVYNCEVITCCRLVGISGQNCTRFDCFFLSLNGIMV